VHVLGHSNEAVHVSCQDNACVRSLQAIEIARGYLRRRSGVVDKTAPAKL
jgi:hypothetical protein